jgi:hypothetical protein
MIAIDEARLNELYQEVLRMEPDMMLEDERLREISERARLKERRDNQQIRALRQSQWAQLVESASSILQWTRDFAGSPKGRKILSTLGEVIIFRAHYFDGKPREGKEYEAWLICDPSGALRYQEFYNGIGKGRSKILTSPVQMASRLHPDYILSALDAIAAGKVWKEIECAIKWRAEIFDIRRQRGWWPPQTSGQEPEFS